MTMSAAPTVLTASKLSAGNVEPPRAPTSHRDEARSAPTTMTAGQNHRCADIRAERSASRPHPVTMSAPTAKTGSARRPLASMTTPSAMRPITKRADTHTKRRVRTANHTYTGSRREKITSHRSDHRGLTPPDVPNTREASLRMPLNVYMSGRSCSQAPNAGSS